MVAFCAAEENHCHGDTGDNLQTNSASRVPFDIHQIETKAAGHNLLVVSMTSRIAVCIEPRSGGKEMAKLNIGDEVPDFELPAVVGSIKQQFKLSDYRGKKNVVLAFYPADWTPVCASQLPSLSAETERLNGYDAQVVSISADSIPSHTAWQKKEIGTMSFPMASDFYPHGAVAKAVRDSARGRSPPRRQRTGRVYRGQKWQAGVRQDLSHRPGAQQ